MYWQKWLNKDYCEELFGSMDIQWGWRKDNGEILRDKMFEVLFATLNIKKKYKAKQIGVSLTSKKKKNEYVLLQLHEFDEKVNITNFFLHLMPYT